MFGDARQPHLYLLLSRPTPCRAINKLSTNKLALGHKCADMVPQIEYHPRAALCASVDRPPEPCPVRYPFEKAVNIRRLPVTDERRHPASALANRLRRIRRCRP